MVHDAAMPLMLKLYSTNILILCVRNKKKVKLCNSLETNLCHMYGNVTFWL